MVRNAMRDETSDEPAENAPDLGRPDWPEEFDPLVEDLGAPLSVHRTSPAQAFRRLVYGFAMIGLGAIVNYLWWFAWGGPILIDKFSLLFLFGIPIYGVALIYRSFADRGLWVMVYPTGVLRWQRGTIVSFAWPEIANVTFHRVQADGGLKRLTDSEGELIGAWLPIENHGSRFFGSHVALEREDGVEGVFPSSLEDYGVLAFHIQTRTFTEQYPRMLEAFQAGQRILFGELAIDAMGLHVGRSTLLWSDFGGATIAQAKLVIARSGKWRSWKELRIVDVPFIHLLRSMIEDGRRRGMPTVTDADNDE